jgi:L-fucose mutarotase
MLKNIPKLISPELLKVLMEMGHGDEIVIADGNFPSQSYGQKVIRLDGLNVPEILEAVLQFFPLDPYVDYPVAIMELVPGDNVKTPIWDEYKAIIEKSDEVGNFKKGFENVERFAFYDRAKEAYAIIATSEAALYANIILKKGLC